MADLQQVEKRTPDMVAWRPEGGSHQISVGVKRVRSVRGVAANIDFYDLQHSGNRNTPQTKRPETKGPDIGWCQQLAFRVRSRSKCRIL